MPEPPAAQITDRLSRFTLQLPSADALAILAESADWIDANPKADASTVAMRARLAVEVTARDVLDRTARALGPGPLATESEFAHRRADLELLLRQSHAERDCAALGEMARADRISPW